MHTAAGDPLTIAVNDRASSQAQYPWSPARSPPLDIVRTTRSDRMHRIVMVLAAATLIGAGAAAAQSSAMMEEKAGMTTYTGCLTASPNGTFSLTGAVRSGEPMKHESMKDDSMKHDAMMKPPLTLASTSVDFAKHAGQKVSVTGSPAHAMGGMKMDGTKMDAMGKDAMAPAAFTVTSLKVVSTSCS
jgi:hypothetical protein